MPFHPSLPPFQLHDGLLLLLLLRTEGRPEQTRQQPRRNHPSDDRPLAAHTHAMEGWMEATNEFGYCQRYRLSARRSDEFE